ncbi:MAG: putative porin [Gammaproteobacteria bacterium]|nr:putative porin [Gammaproteobacteria bacterium]MDH3767144.1 putative porin [Gammaproteobacteria bacterium]
MQKRLNASLVFISLCLFFTDVFAGDQEEIALLRQELQAISHRLAALEARAGPGTKAATTQTKPGWPERVKVNGDLRFRSEGIDEDTRDERWRQRVRARVGLTANVSETAEVGVQLASGSDDPTSTNQSFDGAASSKGLNLDLAYFALTSPAGNKIIGGKMKNPMFKPGKSSLVWDGDLNPEGLAWQFSQGQFFANLTGLWFEERSSRSDSIMLGGQAGVKTKLATGARITAGLAYYDYAATKGRTPFFDGDGHGNTLDASGNYAFDFEILEVFAEFSARLGDMPFSIYADWVKNGAAGAQDTGMAFGAKLGKASGAGTWELGYTYKDLEADAVVGLFTDSDTGGGGTAVSGHILNLAYGFNKRVKGSLTVFLTENSIDTPSERDYNRVQADLSLKY